MRQIRLLVFFALLSSLPICAQQPDPSILTLDRIFNSGDFDSQSIGAVRWLRSGNAYTKLEPPPNGKNGRDLVSYDAGTGSKQVLVSAERLVPPGEAQPLSIQNYDWSLDDQKLLIYTNSKKVWRLN